MSELSQALSGSRRAFIGVAVFSAVINLLMLTGPIFMLQVYDRVLASRSSATLVVLMVIVVYLYALMGLLDIFRSRVLARIGVDFQRALDVRVFGIVLRQAEALVLRDRPAGALKDLSAVQSALASAGMGAVFDLPWAPVFIAILFLFHPWMGMFALVGAALVLLLAIWNQLRTKSPQAKAGSLAATADMQAETARKSIETLRGLGMVSEITGRWTQSRNAALDASLASSDTGGSLTAATKALRLLLQSAVLGLGAYLVLRGELTAGAMIAGSILLGRALAPVEQVVGHWPQFQRARSAWTELSRLLSLVPVVPQPMALPRPETKLEVKNLTVFPPGEQRMVIGGVSFTAQSGDAIAVLGPSAAGKSSLARALCGVWPSTKGEVRLGGAELGQYERDRLGRLIGYLPQEVHLFSGTVAENIARFDANARPEDIVRAALAAGAHDLILQLPDGYDTQVTEGGGRLSGGQRQRIALARAFYGNPILLILDEPNSSLDDPGVQALNHAVAQARLAGNIVLVMSHRPSALTECNKALILDNGQMRAFGPRDEILTRFVRQVSSPTLARGSNSQ